LTSLPAVILSIVGLCTATRFPRRAGSVVARVPATDDQGDCGCRAAHAPNPSTGLLVSGLVLVGLLRRRRSR
jgi:MYXO-CTERM domain-containing protein